MYKLVERQGIQFFEEVEESHTREYIEVAIAFLLLVALSFLG